jgi:hypothetical protein
MKAEFWGLLHDGGIEAISGAVPGVISVEISIRYLREQFPGEGVGFRIELIDCWRFEYQEYDSTPITDIEAIVALEPEIFGFGKGAHTVVVNCVMGTLTMSYGTASIYLDSGEEVSFDELAAASKAYWDAWAARIPQRK